MDWLILIINEFRHIFSVFLAEVLLVLPSLKKRNRFALRMALCIFACCCIGVLYVVFYKYLNEYIMFISVIWYTLIFILTGVFIAVCFEINATLLFWVMIAAYAVQHFVYVLVNEIVFIGLWNYNMFEIEETAKFWLMIFLYAVVAAGTYYAFYRVFKKNLFALGSFFMEDTWRNRIIFGMFAAVFFTSTMLNQMNTQAAEVFNYLSAVSDLINCLFVLILQYISLRMLRINSEKRFSDKLRTDEKKQYDAFKNSVDYVNIKCHDLKHELQRIKQSGSVNTEKLDEIAKGVELYEAFAQTGNETLDVLLTEKNLACINADISLVYMADATGLSDMEASDIYSLFGNLIDNAIEHVKGIADKEKRFIRLFVKPRGTGMILIHEENVYEGEMSFSDGLPQTTKQDKTYHGFGMPSMRKTAQKYGGDLRVSTEDGLFKVDIFIQMKNAE